MANAEPYEFLELFLDEAFWELLTVETNQYMALNKVLFEAQEKQLQALGDVTMPEIKKYFAVYFSMGIVPQCTLTDYWQAKKVITQTPTFHEVMSRNHWCAIWNHLHFYTNILYIYFEYIIYFAMGIVPQCTLTDYCQAKKVNTQTPAFHEVMSRNHWCAIWNHLHFSDNAKTVSGGAPGYDRLFKIRQLIDTAVSKFCTHYQAAKELSLDEMVIAFQR